MNFAGWLLTVNGVGEPGKVRVIATSHHEPNGEQPVRDWVLIEVNSPVVYDYSFYAPLNTAVGVNSEEDTVTRPKPEDISILPSTDSISRSIRQAITAVTVVVTVVSVAGIAITVLSNRRPRR
jgi:hypothetical protein